MSFHVGENLGDYTIATTIGTGSIGQVFQVEHRLTKRKEAVKILSTELATEIQLKRFEREIALQATLNHPNIATVHNAFSWKGYLVLVMELLQGQTLENLLRQGRLPTEDWCTIHSADLVGTSIRSRSWCYPSGCHPGKSVHLS